MKIVDLVFFGDLLRRDSAADFDDGLMSLEAVCEVLEVRFEAFARGKNEAGFSHL